MPFEYHKRADGALIDKLLKIRWTTDKGNAHNILLLLYPQLDYYNQDFHLDHMHPKSWFTKDNIATKIPTDEQDFASDPENWDSIKNLQLLNGSLNSRKNKGALSLWVSANSISNADMQIDANISVDIENFKAFIENREKNIKERLTAILT